MFAIIVPSRRHLCSTLIPSMNRLSLLCVCVRAREHRRASGSAAAAIIYIYITMARVYVRACMCAYPLMFTAVITRGLIGLIGLNN